MGKAAGKLLGLAGEAASRISQRSISARTSLDDAARILGRVVWWAHTDRG